MEVKPIEVKSKATRSKPTKSKAAKTETTKGYPQANSVEWLQLTAGQGPKECGWVVAQLLKVMLVQAQALGIDVEIVESLAYDKMLRNQHIVMPDAYLSVLLRIEGEQAQLFANEWRGTHKWQGESIYRPKHKRINWFVGVERITPIKPVEASINYQQLQRQLVFESMKSSGAGGQHVNTTNSAVRATHKPSGITVRVDTDRSQHRNKRLALERIAMLLLNAETEGANEQVNERWLQHYQVKRGSPVKTFIGQEFKEIN